MSDPQGGRRLAAARNWMWALAFAIAAAASAPAFGQIQGPGTTTTRPVNPDVVEQTGTTWEGIGKVATVIALIVVPTIVGSWLAKKLKMPDHGWKFAVAIGTLAAAAVVVSTGKIKLGPDLSGGITLIYELDESRDADVAAAAAVPTEDEPDDEAAEDEEPAASPPDGKDQSKIEGDEPPADTDQSETDGDEPPTDSGAAIAGMSKDDKIALLITALQERVDPSGTREVSIRKYGEGQIEIIIPHAEQQELEAIERQIYTAGALEFRITASPRFSKHKDIISVAERLPLNRDVVVIGGREVARWVPFDEREFGTVEQARTRGLVARMKGKTPQALVMTDDNLNVTGEYLRSAMPDVDEQARPQVSFVFDAQGAFKFGQLTGNHLPDRSGERYNLGILLDNRLLSAPTIESKITDRGRISGGSMNEEEVNFIVRILNAGSLPAALNKTPISRAKISPTLGKQTIERGSRALIISLVLVALFMAYYYRFAGFVSWFGLAANMLLIVGSMMLINAAFTLPGLAGLVLTVGMSVDANVLIYERLREELKRGAALRMAIRNGFDRASITILDSNVTNLITAAVIYKIAPDNVKGFGITLFLGIVMSVYVAVFLTRLVFDVAERRHWITTLRMRQLIPETNFDFIKYQKYCITGSLILIAAGLAAVAARRADLFDIDFTGGSSVTIVLDEDAKMPFNDVIRELNATPLVEDNVTLVEVGETNTRYTVTTMNQDVEEVEKILKEKFGDKLRTYHVDVSDVSTIPGELNTGDNARVGAPRLPALWGPQPWALSVATLLQPAPAEPPPSEPSDGAQAPADDVEAPAADAKAPPAEATEPASTETDIEVTVDVDEDDARFAGGTRANVKFSVDDEENVGGVNHSALTHMLETTLAATGHKDAAFDLSNPEFRPGSTSERNFTDWTVRLALPESAGRQVLTHLQNEINSQPMFPSSSKIGGRVAARMASDAIAAILFCLVGIIAYVRFRFHGVIYGIAAVVALVHDVLVTLAFVAFSYYIVTFAKPVANLLLIDNFQIGLTMVAAFLTIIGYSLNDTIVIFDRLREVKGKSPHLTKQMINDAVNQTFARTVLTALTSLVSVAVLYIVGGDGIHAFAFALLVGFLAGCYSTIFIANPVLYWLSQRAEAAAAKAAKSRAA